MRLVCRLLCCIDEDSAFFSKRIKAANQRKYLNNKKKLFQTFCRPKRYLLLDTASFFLQVYDTNSWLYFSAMYISENFRQAYDISSPYRKGFKNQLFILVNLKFFHDSIFNLAVWQGRNTAKKNHAAFRTRHRNISIL